MRRIQNIVDVCVVQCLLCLCLVCGYGLSPVRASSPTDPDRDSGSNRTLARATKLRLGGADNKGEISFDEGDRTDWYKVTVKYEGYLEVVVHNRIEGDLQLEVYETDKKAWVGTSRTSETGDGRLVFPVQAGRTYYFKVYAQEAGDTGNYSIRNIFHDTDTTPPNIILSQTEWILEEPLLILTGTVKENEGIVAMRLQGEDMFASTSVLNQNFGEVRSFSHPIGNIPLNIPIRLIIEAEDEAGNVGKQDIQVTWKDPGPTIQLDKLTEDTLQTKDTLVFIGGMAEDNEQIARLWINGEDLLNYQGEHPSSDVNVIAKHQIRFTCTLKDLAYGKHPIHIVAEDNYGQKSEKTLTIHRDAPPRLTILHPRRQGDTTQANAVTLEGRVSDDVEITQIIINGVNISSAEMSQDETDLPQGAEIQWKFSHTINNLKYGENLITVEARDNFGNMSRQQMTLTRDDIHPTITIHSPRDGDRIAEDVVIVKGEVFDADGLKEVTINSIPVQVESSGAFRYELAELPQGPFTITVKAVDSRDKSSVEAINIDKIDETDPRIEILEPQDPFQIPGSKILIKVVVSDNDRIWKITIHGQEKGGTSRPGEARELTHLIETLKEGENIITVTAVDVNGNTSTQSVTVTSLNPDYNSGQDSTPQGAFELELNGQDTMGTLAYDEGDRTDWYKVYVPQYGKLEMFLQTEERDGDLNIEVYQADSKTGFPIEASKLSEELTPGTGNEYVDVQTEGEQWLFVKVFAQQLGDAGDYTLKNSFKELDRHKPQIEINQKELTTSEAFIIISGTVKDEKGVAAIIINGTEISPLPEPLGGSSGDLRAFSHKVALHVGKNNVEIQAKDLSGNLASKEILVTRENPNPEITLTEPGDGAREKKSSVLIKGTVWDDTAVEQVTINDIDITGSLKSPTKASPQHGRKPLKEFEYQLSLDAYGKHTVIVTAFDNLGERDEKTLTVYRDAPPEIIVKPALQDTHTKEKSIEVSGRVENDWEGTDIKVNGVTLARPETIQREDGTFQQEFQRKVDLKYGANSISIEAEDKIKNSTTLVLTIYRDEIHPEIMIDPPLDQIETEAADIVIKGRVNDDDDIAVVTIDDEPVKLTPEDGAYFFSHTLSLLTYGTKTITVLARDTRDNRTPKTLHITRIDREDPVIEIISPQEDLKTRAEKMTVKIKLKDNHALASVNINGEEQKYEKPLGMETFLTYDMNLLVDGTNPVKVVVTDESGNNAEHILRIHKVAPPSIMIPDETSEGVQTAEEILTITGTIQTADDVASLNINGDKIPVAKGEDNTFEYTAKGLQIGRNTLELIVIDTLAGTTRRDLIITRHDNIRPEIEIKSPDDDFKTRDDAVPVTVTVKDNHRIAEFMIADQRFEGTDVPGKEKTVTYMVTGLTDGTNPIRVIVRDVSGNSNSQALKIVKVPAPAIVITRPQPPIQTVAERVELVGYIQSDVDLTSVKIGGQDVAFERAVPNTFSQDVHLLAIGEHEIEMIATDSLGGQSRQTVTMTRNDPDYLSGSDGKPEGAIQLLLNGSRNNLTVNYDEGDRSDWFKVTLDTTGDWSVTMTTDQGKKLDLELYGPDGKTPLQRAETSGAGTTTLIAEVTEAGQYYAKVMAHDLGDNGHYTIRNEFKEVDRIPPELTLASPQEKEVWLDQDAPLIIRGTASDNSELEDVRFELNKKPVIAIGSAEGDEKHLEFQYQVSGFQPGSNRLRIIVIDHNNQTTDLEITILVGKDVPFIHISSVEPADITATGENGHIRQVTTQSGTITIQGKLSNASDHKTLQINVSPTAQRGLTLNPPVIPFINADGTFQAEVALDIGQNEISIEAIEQEEPTDPFTFVALRTGMDPSPTVQTLSDPLEKYLRLRPHNVYAVVIGIGDYQDENIRDLRFTVKDAQGFYNILRNDKYGRVPEENIRLLLNEQATVKNIKTALRTWLKTNTGEEDSVLIYYAGHGARQEGDTYWVTHDANLNDLYSSALSSTTIVEMLKQIKSKRLVTFLDACHSADLVKPGLRETAPLGISFEKFSGEGRVTISASDGKQYSLELEEYGHGVFTYYLLKGLKGAADMDDDTIIDVDEIWHYVKDRVTEAVQKVSHLQEPTMQGEHKSRIFLTFNVPKYRNRIDSERFAIREAAITKLYREKKLTVEEFKQLLQALKEKPYNHILNDYFNGDLALEEFKKAIFGPANP